jgi:hypothetical protein
MKRANSTCVLVPGGVVALFMLVALCFSASSWAADKQTSSKASTNAPAKSVAPANELDMAAVIPKSVFAVPTTAREGRNPFFPQAKVVAQVPKEREPSLDTSVFILNGITGPPLRSAMINGRTFLAGEEGEVRLQNGAKVLIKCAEIRDEGATIIVGGVQRELRLRFGI